MAAAASASDIPDCSPPRVIPDAIFRFAGPLYWSLVNSLLTLDTKPGRKVAARFHNHGSPLIRVSVEDVERAGAARLPRISGAADGKPMFDVGTSDGGVPALGAVPGAMPGAVPVPGNIRTIIWATGYRPAFDWIEGLPLDARGWPATTRGVVAEIPGLFFVGMPFQYALTSGLVGGVGRDAEYVVAQLRRTMAGHETTAP